MDENSSNRLPPLPPSDSRSMEINQFDNFYRHTPRSFWKEAEINKEVPKEFEKCEHFFLPMPDGAKCKKCNFGLIGFFEISDGKLAYKGKTLEI